MIFIYCLYQAFKRLIPGGGQGEKLHTSMLFIFSLEARLSGELLAASQISPKEGASRRLYKPMCKDRHLCLVRIASLTFLLYLNSVPSKSPCKATFILAKSYKTVSSKKYSVGHLQATAAFEVCRLRSRWHKWHHLCVEQHILRQNMELAISKMCISSLRAALQAWKGFLVARKAKTCQEGTANQQWKHKRLKACWKAWRRRICQLRTLTASLMRMQSLYEILSSQSC